jgi:hypothetical protein
VIKKSPVWIHRPLLNVDDVFAFAAEAGIKKMMPADQLHLTLATVRSSVEWHDLDLLDDVLTVPAGHKTVQILGWSVKALTFGHPEIKRRHEELLALYPSMDHALLRPHVSLYRGGKMPRMGYEGELVFGPERAERFDAGKARDIKHVLVSEHAFADGSGIIDRGDRSSPLEQAMR